MTPRFLDVVLDRPELADLDPARRRLAIRSLLAESDVDDAATVATRLADYVDGFGPLTPLMEDERVTDVLINGPDEVWVERDGALLLTEVAFGDPTELRDLICMLVGKAGRSVDISRPIADARLADGSRIHVVLPPIAPDGPLVSIRRFSRRIMTLADLEAAGMMDVEVAAQLRRLLSDRQNLVIAGATGAGKTTLMNALLQSVPREERIVTVEEVPELRLPSRNAVSLLARSPNVEGAGEVTLIELLRAALRMRPDRIVVGEVRGAEALVALSAFSTGHEGSMVTLHARSGSSVAARLFELALQSSRAPSERALNEQIRRAFDAVVFLERSGGRRIVSAIHTLG